MRKKYSFLNSAVSFGFLLLNSLLGFISMKIYINSFSSELNGLLSSINNIVTYCNIVEAGLSSAIIYMYYKPLAEGDTVAVANLFRGSKKILNKISLALAILILIATFSFPLIIKNNPFNYLFVISLFFLIGFSTVLENFFITPFALLLNADQKNYVFAIVSNSGKILLRLAGVIYLYYGGNILFFLSYNYVALAIIYIVLSRLKKRNYTFLERSTIADQSAVKMTKDVIVHKIATVVTYNTDTIILAVFLSLKDASVYTVYNALYCVLLKNALGAIYNAIVPSLGNLFIDAPEKSYRIISVFETFVFLTATVGFASFYYLLNPVINLIANNSYIDHTLSMLFLLMCYIDILRTPALNITAASGLFRETKVAPFLEIGLNLSLSLILVNFLGIYGVLLATIITYTVYLLVYYPIVYNQKRFPLRRVYMKMVLHLLLVFAFLWSDLSIDFNADIFTFAGKGILGVCFFTSVCFLSNWVFFNDDCRGIFHFALAFTRKNDKEICV